MALSAFPLQLPFLTGFLCFQVQAYLFADFAQYSAFMLFFPCFAQIIEAKFNTVTDIKFRFNDLRKTKDKKHESTKV